METKIVPLVCPQCGNTNNVSERELAFGVEFACKFCDTTAVLIINQQLHIRRPGEPGPVQSREEKKTFIG
jgi:hypothetical protein